MSERLITQILVHASGDLVGCVCSDGSAWVALSWKNDMPDWRRIPGPPADEPAVVDAKMPPGILEEDILLLTIPPKSVVRLSIYTGVTQSVARELSPADAVALGQALIAAAARGGTT